MGIIHLEGIKIFAYHGVFDVEQAVGQWYEISLSVTTDFAAAAKTDELTGTIDYAALNNLVHREMAIKSKLVEHVAQRIANAIKKEFPAIEKGTICISKLNPPVKGQLNSMKIELSF